jgi:hypothetical protein
VECFGKNQALEGWGACRWSSHSALEVVCVHQPKQNSNKYTTVTLSLIFPYFMAHLFWSSKISTFELKDA